MALEESTVNRQSALDIPEKTAGKQLSKEAQPEPESPSLEEHIPVDETARAQWTDFADKWRLDYLPAFSRWAAPTSTSDYLMWVFSRNMDALKAQGYMTKSYVETEIKAHFEVENLTHEGLAKTWNFDGETYTAVPGGVKDRPARAARQHYPGKPRHTAAVLRTILPDGKRQSAGRRGMEPLPRGNYQRRRAGFDGASGIYARLYRAGWRTNFSEPDGTVH